MPLGHLGEVIDSVKAALQEPQSISKTVVDGVVGEVAGEDDG